MLPWPRFLDPAWPPRVHSGFCSLSITLPSLLEQGHQGWKAAARIGGVLSSQLGLASAWIPALHKADLQGKALISTSCRFILLLPGDG